MYTLNGNDIRYAILGATILGGGGGGAAKAGNDMFDQYKSTHGIEKDIDVQCQVMSVDEMDDNGYAASSCVLGAPTKIMENECAPFVVGSFNAIADHAKSMNKDVMYSMAIEVGGQSTVVPMIVAMEKGIPYLDCDGSGRAVPAIDTLLFHVNGLKTFPYTLADNKGSRLIIDKDNARDAHTAEEIARNCCMAFGMLAGISGWLCKKNDIMNNLCVGTLTKCIKIGKALVKARESAEKDYFGAMQAAGIECKELGRGQITAINTEAVKGFDRGFVEVSARDGSKKWTTRFLNENLAVEETVNGEATTVMTVPDVICYINADTGMPLSNADIIDKNGNLTISEDQDIIVGLVKVDERWWNNDAEFLRKSWGFYFDVLGRPDQAIVPYK